MKRPAPRKVRVNLDDEEPVEPVVKQIKFTAPVGRVLSSTEALQVRLRALDEHPHWEETSCPAGPSTALHDEFCACGGEGSLPVAVVRRLIEKELGI
jgi:hypothetical protein